MCNLQEKLEAATAVLIALSGYGDTAHRQQTEAAGFTVHLMKPVDPPQLRDLLAGLAREKGTDGVSGRDTIAPP